MADEFDVAVLGGGIAGLTAARIARAAGRSVLLVEEKKLGGQNVWTGSVPCSALRYAARARHEVTRASSFGIHSGEVSTDFTAVMAYVRQTVQVLALSETTERLEKSGITVKQGRGRFIDRRTIQVGNERLRVGRSIICTGSRGELPKLEGLSEISYLTQESLFALESQPEHLIVLGSGSTTLELAQTFRRLGSRVTVLVTGNRVLPEEDPETATAAQAYLEAEGITFLPTTSTDSVQRREETIRMIVAAEASYNTVEGDALLVDAGRRPNVEDLGLDQIGLEVGSDGITTDSAMKTAVDGVYAAGDVTGGPYRAHVAAYQAQIAAYNAAGHKERVDEGTIPSVIFIDPEFARVGAREAEARARYGDGIAVSTLPYLAIDRAVVERRIEGVVKLITIRRGGLKPGRSEDVILGAHIIGAHAGDLIYELAMAMNGQMTAQSIALSLSAYPSYSAGNRQAAGLFYPAGRATTDLRQDLLRGN